VVNIRRSVGPGQPRSPS